MVYSRRIGLVGGTVVGRLPPKRAPSPLVSGSIRSPFHHELILPILTRDGLLGVPESYGDCIPNTGYSQSYDPLI